jgi:hypothetical protein
MNQALNHSVLAAKRLRYEKLKGIIPTTYFNRSKTMWNISTIWVAWQLVQDVQVKLNPGCHGKSSIPQKKTFYQQIGLKFKEQTSTAFYGAETWTCRKVDQKYRESFEMWCWRRMEKISWTDRVRNEEVLHSVKDRNIVHAIKRRKAYSIGHILRRNCLLKHIIEGKIVGKIKVMGK